MQSFKVERDNKPALFFSIWPFLGKQHMITNVRKKKEKRNSFLLLISIQITSVIHVVNSIQLQMDCPRSLPEFTPAWLCKGLTSVDREGHCDNTSLNSYIDFEKKHCMCLCKSACTSASWNVYISNCLYANSFYLCILI